MCGFRGGHRHRTQLGARTLLEFSQGPGQPNLLAGDIIRISRQIDAQGATSYGFYDYERTWPLALLAALFAIVIVAVARWRGLRALIGIVVAFLVLAVFLLPALRDGAPAVPVALVASAAILFAVIYLAHGVSLRTSAALIGHTHLDVARGVPKLGCNRIHSSDRPVARSEQRGCGLHGPRVDQGSAAGRIHHRITRRAQRRDDHPGLSGVRVGASGARVTQTGVPARHAGRQRPHSEHRPTLVFAYAGSSLPLLLLFSVANRSLADVVTSEGVAIEIARSAVGGIALALSVPLTTAVAAALATPQPDPRTG